MCPENRKGTLNLARFGNSSQNHMRKTKRPFYTLQELVGQSAAHGGRRKGASGRLGIAFPRLSPTAPTGVTWNRGLSSADLVRGWIHLEPELRAILDEAGLTPSRATTA